MQIAVVGSHDFTLGFQLAGVLKLYNPKNESQSNELISEFENDINDVWG